jgi:hypothetical protein
VVVGLATQDHEVQGRGVSTDIVEGAARAYVNALNRLERYRSKASNTETP